MAAIAFEQVGKVYDDGTSAVEQLSLDVADGEFLVLVGPSDSGKSTALRMLAGLEEVTHGEVRIGDRVVNDVAPKDRDVAMVFQSYALYPHMSVERNMGFALELAKRPKATISSRVGEAAERLGIAKLLERRPAALSGGQRQRVALGRAIVREPQVFLMDEPLSNLDAKLRVEMRLYIARLHRELGATIVYVTHDQVEAMTMGDRVAVMRDGRLEQCAAPRVLYEQPANVFVASFIGSPAMNLLDGVVDGASVRLGGERIALPEEVAARLRPFDGGTVIVGLRPEAVTLGDGPARLTLPVVLAESTGADLLVHLRLEAAPDGLLTARLPGSMRVSEGELLPLALDPAALHFFEPEEGRAI
jgi:multiple sugar transport system ATP-binding protein